MQVRATIRDKSVDTLPENGPFLHSGSTYSLLLSTPTPSTQVFFLLQTTLIRGVRGFTAFKKNEIIDEVIVC